MMQDCTAINLLEDGNREYEKCVSYLDRTEEAQLIRDKLTLNVGLRLNPMKENAEVDRSFLNKINSSNPRYSGWPAWVDTTNCQNEDNRPFVSENRWHAVVSGLEKEEWPHFDCMFFDPRGEFYLKRVMPEDLYRDTKDKNVMAPIEMTYFVVEIIAVGLQFARALDWAPDGSASIALSWTGLKRRSLFMWPGTRRFISARGMCVVPACSSEISVPLMTTPSDLAPFVANAIKPLFLAFGGFELSGEVFKELVDDLINR